MSTQSITDYLTKQIFIEKNIVTFRSLSRHLAIHVNTAKNELAMYHHNAPYQSQACIATFLLSGEPKSNKGYRNSQDSNQDYYMDSTQPTNNGEGEEEENDGDNVPHTTVMIVNESDLEDAKALYAEILSIHVYSLSPAPLHDAGLICPPTASVRSADKSRGPEFAITVGRIVGKGVKVGATKKKMQPPPAPVAGPSKPKQTTIPEPKQEVKLETKEKPSAAPEKPKASAKLMNFFGAPAKPKDSKEVKKIKQEEPVPDTTKRMFFSKPAAKATTSDVPQKLDAPQKADAPQRAASSKTLASKAPPSVSSAKDEKVPEKQNEKEKPARGVKRKSSVGLETRDKSPENTSAVSKVEGSTRVRRKVVISDDEDDEIIPKKPIPRKSRLSYRTESLESSDAENDVMGLMDIADDEVEKVSRVPSTPASSNERDEFEDEDDGDESILAEQDEDVHMSDDTSLKAKVTRKRKPKAVIPVGRNGLKKKKVTKTRRTKDANGYIVKEDYSDWESVASGEEPEEPAPPKPKPKAKPKVAAVKKEEEEVKIRAAPAPKAPAPKKAPIKPSATTSKAKPSGGTKVQPRLMNFFGPKKTT